MEFVSSKDRRGLLVNIQERETMYLTRSALQRAIRLYQWYDLYACWLDSTRWEKYALSWGGCDGGIAKPGKQPVAMTMLARSS